MFTTVAHAQSPADWWYFGHNAGLHFTSGGVVPVGNGALSTAEGCATISTSSGDLLFYTDGIFVYDRTHNQMPNGFGLLGDPSSTHSSVVVPNPQNSNIFYVFTVDAGGTSGVGMHYSVVDLSLNGGFGDVVSTQKNIFLVDSVGEKITAVAKSNGYWVITTRLYSDEAYAYEVTSAGVNTTPVISHTGFPIDAGFGFGIKASSSSNLIAAAHMSNDSIHMYELDVTTGILTGVYKIGTTVPIGVVYGLEFSPNGKVLYMQPHNTGVVYQYDLTAGNSAAISASQYPLGTGTSGGGGMLQLGPDQKIYCARNFTTRLSVINNPNSLGAAAGWQDTAVVLTSGATCRWGLPTFIQSFFNTSFLVEQICFGDSTAFLPDTLGVDSLIWDFGDPSSGSLNQSKQLFPKHLYSDTGTYTVTLVAFSDTLVDTVVQDVYIYPRQTLNLAPDTTLCSGTVFTVDVGQPFAQFLWQDGSTADTFSVNTDSLLSVTVYGVCDTLSDSIRVRFIDSLFFDLGPDTNICGGSSYLLGVAATKDAKVFWNTGDTLDTIVVTSSGLYEVNVINGCGTFSDTVNVVFIDPPAGLNLPDDTVNCYNREITLSHPNQPGVKYFWSDSSTRRTYVVDTTEVVWLTAVNQCGILSDTVSIVFNGEVQLNLGPDTVICDEDSIPLVATWPRAKYLWNTGDTTDTVWTGNQSRNYTVTVTYGACEYIDSRKVDLSPLVCIGIECQIFQTNVFSPNADGVNDLFRITSTCEFVSFTLYIYNRWGQLVHKSTNAAYGWDGTIGGMPAEEGVYFYHLEYKHNVVVDADRYAYRGVVHLIR
ncbi:MAG: hypothetical protein Kow0075_06500 [Salibacteraceae bacterium]